MREIRYFYKLIEHTIEQMDVDRLRSQVLVDVLQQAEEQLPSLW